MHKVMKISIIAIILLLNGISAFSQGNLASEIKDPELEQEMAWLKAETYVITASRVKENIKKAPASITVVTEKQIRQMGAKDLADVLDRAVPGMNIWRFYLGQFNVFVRGNNPTDSGNVLLMINSHPVNNAQSGGWSFAYDTLIVDNIKRIEFVRGPGSALYGANAFAGVINVITKDAKDIDGLEIRAQTGSENTQHYNLMHGNVFSDVELVFNFNYFKTHGFRGLIEEDIQTQIDSFWAPLGFPPASLAPGRMDGDDERYDVALNLKYKGLQFDGRYIDRERAEPIGWLAALNYESVDSIKDYFVTLSYETSIREGLEVYAKVYRNLYDVTMDLQLFPPGFVSMTPTGIPAIWPEGMLGETSLKAARTGIDFQTILEIDETNSVIAGVTYEEGKVSGYEAWGNYIPTEDPLVLIPLPSLQALPDIYVQDSRTREFKAIYIQDIWNITDDLRVTAGARYDHYSDFGSAFSPRVGLTWEYMEGFDLKLLYGHAFRSPSFFELYDPASGNPNLDAEEVDTYEVSLGVELTPSLNGRVTFYYREARDLIVASSNVSPWNFINRGKRQDQGVELEIQYNFGRGTYLAANYSYMNFDSKFFGQRHQGDISANIRLSSYMNFYADFNFVEDIKRWPEDTRDDPSGYETVNVSLIAKKVKGYERFELRASVYNLFDEDYAYDTGSGILPNDLPAQGVNFIFEIRYKL